MIVSFGKYIFCENADRVNVNNMLAIIIDLIILICVGIEIIVSCKCISGMRLKRLLNYSQLKNRRKF